METISSFDSHVYVKEVDENYNIQIHGDDVRSGDFEGILAYTVYLTDKDPYHDFMVGVTRKAYPNDGSITEEKQLSELEGMINEALPSAIETFEKLLVTYNS